MIKLLLVLLITISIASPSFAAPITEWIEDFTSCSPLGCGCNDNCGRSGETEYTFSDMHFINLCTSEFWADSAHQTTGGINNSPYFRAVFEAGGACSPNESYMKLRKRPVEKDSSFYFRAGYRFSSGWNHDAGGYEQKLFYIMVDPEETTTRAPLFIKADYTGEDTLWWYIVEENVWVSNNANNDYASHNYRFRPSQHYGKWWVFVAWFDYTTSTNAYKMWLTTEDGATNCSAGTTCLVGGVQEFNNYLYFDFVSPGTASYVINRVDYGFYINNNNPISDKATVDFDSFAMSETALSSNVFTGGETPSPAKVQGLTIYGGSVR